MNDYNYLRDEYPPIISSEQLRKLLHISKQKCVWMLQNGIIPCIDTHKKTRRYTIRLDDVIAYITASEQAPENQEIPAGTFSSKPKRSPIMPAMPPDGFRESLTDEWYNVDDVLTIADVAKLTGYSENTVDRWILKGSLRSVLVQTGLITCKEWLINFYCADGYRIAQKSEKHVSLIKKLALASE